MGFLLTLHSINRWIIILIALLAVFNLAKDILAKVEASKRSKLFSALYTGFMDLQLILGGAAFMLPDMSDGGRHMHMGFMVLAIIIGHLPAIYKKRKPDLYPKLMIAAIVISLFLVVIGISTLGGQNRWLHLWGIY